MLRFLAVVMVLAILAGCDETPEVYVQCNPQIDRYACSLEQRAGDKPTNTCWTLKLACVNGTTTEARSCFRTQPSGTSSTTMLGSDFSKWDQCDQVRSVSLVDIEIKPI